MNESAHSDSERKEEWRTWEASYANAITDSINYVRNKRGLKIRDLVIRLVAVGWPATESTLNGILSAKKRKSYSVGDIFAFALALDVPPAVLIFGLPAPNDALRGPLFNEDTPIEKLPFWFDSPALALEVPGDLGLTSLPVDLAAYFDAYETVLFQNRMMIAANDPRFDVEAVRETLPNHQNGMLLTQAISKLATAARHIDSYLEEEATRPEIRPLTPELLHATEIVLEADGLDLPLQHLNSPEEINDARKRVARLLASPRSGHASAS